MKTLRSVSSTFLLLLGFAALPLHADPQVSASVALESDFIFRGFQRADSSIQPSLDFNAGKTYFGTWTSIGLDKDDVDEIDLYVGYYHDLHPLVSLDVGGIVYIVDNDQGAVPDQYEIYTGFALEYQFSPSVYFYYDFETGQVTIEASAGHEIPFAEKFALEFGAHAGLAFNREGPGETDWSYLGATADVVWYLRDNFKASLGGRYSVRDSEVDLTDQDYFWWGLSVTTGF